jgi:2-alkyl-3-oxoalkanoate reductase
MRVAITGGSGFLGQEVARLLLHRGHEITSTSRGLTNAQIDMIGCNAVVCDINDTAKLISHFRNTDCVVHCAALSAPWGKWVEFQKQNVAGTESVVTAVTKANVRRLIHVSSSSVYFSYADKFDLKENSTLPPPVNAYAESKQQAEVAASRFCGELFVLRPRGIFGPGDNHLLPRLLRVMKTRPLPLLRGGQALVDITDVHVVADAIATMVTANAEQSGTYNISQGSPIIIKDLVERIAAGLSISYRWRSLPTGLAFLGAKTLEAIASLDPKSREPLVTCYGLGLFAYSHTLDISKAEQVLKWQPKLTLDESLLRTFASMKAAA